MKIFLAQLSHETDGALQNRCFPLGIGVIGACLKDSLPEETEVELFKRPSELNARLSDGVPDIMMFSVFIWNENLTLETSKRIKEVAPDTLVILGGPNLSLEYEKNLTFLKANPWVDLLVLGEGELVALAIVESFSSHRSINQLKHECLPSTLSLESSSICLGPLAPDKRNLEDWPCGKDVEIRPGVFASPYLSGLFDTFFRTGERPLMETNRGCPFTCSFCQQGYLTSGKIRFKPLEQIRKELRYIAERANETKADILTMEFADSNFLMYERDIEIAENIREIQDEFSYPLSIGSSTGKNRVEHILRCMERLKPGTMFTRVAVQSLSPSTLKAVQRQNIKIGHYMQINRDIHEKGGESNADVMLGLPEETLEQHFEGLHTLLDSNVTEFSTPQTIVLKGTEMERDDYKQKFGIETGRRAIPETYNAYDILGKRVRVCEYEDIIKSTNAMSLDDYLSCRKFHLIIMLYHNTRLLSHAYSMLHDIGIPRSRLFQSLYAHSEESIGELLAQYAEATLGELDVDVRGLNGRSEIDDLTSNKIFRFLSLGLFRHSLALAALLQGALEDIVPEGYSDSIRDMVEIFKMRVLPIDGWQNMLTYVPESELCEKVFGNRVLLSLSETQVGMLAMFKKIYTVNSDRVNKMVYHLRPANLSYQVSPGGAARPDDLSDHRMSR